MSTNSTFCCYQGSFDLAGTLQENIAALAKYDVISISRVKDRAPPNGCDDTGYPAMPSLIAGIRQANPNTKIYGYVPSTADAPVGTACGFDPNYVQVPWSAPNGICSAFIGWVNDWKVLGVDGINIDVACYEFIDTVLRDNIFSYVKLSELHVMANITTPDYFAKNMIFACSSSYLGQGDSVMIEGYIVQEGRNTLPGTNASIATLGRYRSKGINLVALATENWGHPQPAGSQNDLNARSFFEEFYKPGDVYQYTSADLGVVTHKIP